MKVSLNWLRDFLDLDKSPSEIADILTSLGLEVEGWETVRPSPVDLDKVFTGKVLECERIPDTDHLSATRVDVGDGSVRSIVCGAPNVAAGQKVLVALPGANVFSKDGQLFQIGERKVKGVPSQGMICAQDELGIGHDHSGIMILPDETPLGISAAAYLRQESDTVIEIGLTPNRADATNHFGVAKDLAAYLRVQENRDIQLRNPQSAIRNPQSAINFGVEVLNAEACPRYTGMVIRGIQVAESPDWLKNRLLAVGQRPINNVVDITNYVRVELGQPLHAFDLAEIKGGKILVKTLPEGTPFKTLDEVERKLFAEDLMICDAESTPMCIGGVFGGFSSGVSEKTTAIFLESAFFNPKWIRRSMLRHNLRTDAAWSFEKGVDPNGCRRALECAAQLIVEIAGGEIASDGVDIYPNPVQPARVACGYARVNALIGENLSKERIKKILAALEIGIDNETDTDFVAVIPTDKPDVTREADVVEEILRIHGLDNVPIPTQIRSSMEIAQRPSPDAVRNLAAEFLAANGFNECMGMSLSNSAYYLGEGAVLPLEREKLVFIHNSANQGLDCLRPTMLFSGLEAAQRNQNRQHPDLRLFEFGKTYQQSPVDNGRQAAAAFTEISRLSILLSGAHAPESWHPSAKKNVDFYTLKAIVQNLLARLGVSGFQETALNARTDEPAGAAFQYAMKYHRGPQEIVTFGAVQSAVLKKMDVKNAVFFADINFDNVLKAVANNKIQFAELNRFPTVRRDLALVLDRSVTFADIRQLANKTAKKLLSSVNLFDVFEDEQKLGAGKKSCAVSFIFEDPEKTLQEKEIDSLMQQLQQAFENNLKATIRKG
ncbi:MAG: phenylalanine--tRNA ligase subunit beta [Haliscomenobacteraceae bacterium CHB4]|nr:Phenylalanine--tRNA ligase beta subunit [Saprospiraceae bacterium]MCE7923342.1 phenylalanine--tRNA ligase subunit beta [Haliscomenobacteraceae bacterium CHB4]